MSQEPSRIQETIIDAWLDAGVELATAERLADFTLRVGMTAALLTLFDRFRDKVFIAALQRVLFLNQESQRAAAKRLCVSQRALAKAEADIRKRLAEGGGIHDLLRLNQKA